LIATSQYDIDFAVAVDIGRHWRRIGRAAHLLLPHQLATNATILLCFITSIFSLTCAIVPKTRQHAHIVAHNDFNAAVAIKIGNQWRDVQRCQRQLLQ
jgi:hypothetical protein